MKVATDTTKKVGTSFAKVAAGVAKKQRDPLLKWRPPLLKKVDGSFAKVAVRTAWKGPTQLLLLLLESSRWTRENPDKIR